MSDQLTTEPPNLIVEELGQVNAVVIRLQGEWDLHNNPVLREAIHEALVRPCRLIVVNLREVPLIDSSILNTLYTAHRRTQDQDKELTLVVDEEECSGVKRLLDLTGLRTILTVLATEEEAFK